MRIRGWIGAGFVCMGAACAFGSQTTDDDASSQSDATTKDASNSDAGQTVCNGVPTDTKSDKANCGSCGHACAPSAACTYGTCQCPNGGTDCNGTCIDLKTDVQNCGKCGEACAASLDGGLTGGGTWACLASVCTIQCPNDASAACTTGCFDTTTDKAHCGNCGTDCNTESCCSSNCTDTTSDSANCGKCATACLKTQTCSNSHCCTTGQTYCTSACTNTATDVKNCGACGTACKTGETCNASKCCAAPGQGTCVHSLCDGTTANPLKKACDPNGCVTKVCNADSFCCTTDWDSLCAGEVATYCSPYSCTGC
jgi:hypothetical protein